MKNSLIRRVFFSLKANLRFFYIGLKDFSSFRYENHFDPIWGRFWSYLYEDISGIKSKFYLSETFFYNKLEKNVNDFELASFFEHKGYISEVLGSHTIIEVVNCISGVVYDYKGKVVDPDAIITILSDYQKSSEFVVKRSLGTGGGKGVEIGTIDEITPAIIEYVNKGHDFVVQPRIEQHSLLKKFNPSSLNTIRFLTLSYGGDIFLVSTIFRMGNGGKIDNSAAGGISIGVTDDGFLRNFAVDHNFNKYNEHPSSKVDFSEEYKLPFFTEMSKIVKDKHRKLKSHGLVSWDVSVDDIGNVSIIEYNVVWSEINFHQANNGPIFHDFIPVIEMILKDR